jgi:hypothetical protein
MTCVLKCTNEIVLICPFFTSRLFLVEGIVTVLIGIAIYFLLPDCMFIVQKDSKFI